jgi:hypothetical protein
MTLRNLIWVLRSPPKAYKLGLLMRSAQLHRKAVENTPAGLSGQSLPAGRGRGVSNIDEINQPRDVVQSDFSLGVAVSVAARPATEWLVRNIDKVDQSRDVR